MSGISVIQKKIDYKALLEKYIFYVMDSKGCNFLNDRYRHQGDFEFTEKEWAELN